MTARTTRRRLSTLEGGSGNEARVYRPKYIGPIGASQGNARLEVGQEGNRDVAIETGGHGLPLVPLHLWSIFTVPEEFTK